MGKASQSTEFPYDWISGLLDSRRVIIPAGFHESLGRNPHPDHSHNNVTEEMSHVLRMMCGRCLPLWPVASWPSELLPPRSSPAIQDESDSETWSSPSYPGGPAVLDIIQSLWFFNFIPIRSRTHTSRRVLHTLNLQFIRRVTLALSSGIDAFPVIIPHCANMHQ